MQKTRLKITEASKLYSIARSTIYRKIKDGELSIDTDKKIDLSEMMRVFGAIPSQLQTNTTVESVAVEPVSLQSDTTLLLQERIATLEKELAVAIALKDEFEKERAWLKQQFEQAQNTVKLLEHKQATPPPVATKTNLFGRIIKAISNE